MRTQNCCLILSALILFVQIPVWGWETPIREVTVKVVVDEEFQHGFAAPSVLPRILGRVSDRFQEKFRICFKAVDKNL